MIKITITETDGRKTEVEIPLPGEVVVYPSKAPKAPEVETPEQPKLIADLEDEDDEDWIRPKAETPEGRRRRRRTRVDRAEVIRLLQTGRKKTEIAEMLGASYSNICRIEKELKEARDEEDH